MDSVRATVRVYSVPPRRDDDEYDQRDWPRTPLFSCLLHTGKHFIADDEQSMAVRLETFGGELIATARFDGISNVEPVASSSKHFVLIVGGGDLRAVLGIAFVDRKDSIDLSLVLHNFAHRRHDAERLKSSGWATRMQRLRGEVAGPRQRKSPYVPSAPAPALAPPGAGLRRGSPRRGFGGQNDGEWVSRLAADSDDEEQGEDEFGEFETANRN